MLIGQEPGLADLQPKIDKAIAYILARNEARSADKVVAELTFGFWTTIYNMAYENVLWKQLRRAFAHLSKQDRQRSTVSVVVNDIRRLRNRAYHNESICWRLNQLQGQHQKFYSLSLGLSPHCAPGFSS